MLTILDAALTGYISGEEKVPTQILNSATGGYFISINADEVSKHGSLENRMHSAKMCNLQPFWFNDARFSIVAQDGTRTTSGSDEDVGMPKLSKTLPIVTSMEEATAQILHAMTYKIAKGLGILQHDVDLTRPLHSYGVDSLVAEELRDWTWKETRAQLSKFAPRT